MTKFDIAYIKCNSRDISIHLFISTVSLIKKKAYFRRAATSCPYSLTLTHKLHVVNDIWWPFFKYSYKKQIGDKKNITSVHTGSTSTAQLDSPSKPYNESLASHYHRKLRSSRATNEPYNEL